LTHDDGTTEPQVGEPWSSIERRGLLAIVGLAAVIRFPFWIIALQSAVDGDTGIVGLMALEGRGSATFWGQPYGSPLDAWLAWPFVTALGCTSLAVRLPYFLLSLALVPLCGAIARRLTRTALLPAAFVMASPPAYFLVHSALPPPLYPSTLVLLASLLWGALALGARLAAGRPAALGLVAFGAGAGLALWTHLMSFAVLLPCAVFLWRRAAGRRALLGLALVTLLISAAPLLSRVARDPDATMVIDLAESGQSPLSHGLALLPRLHEPLLALVGARVPITADDPERFVELGFAGRVLLPLLYLTAVLAAGCSVRARPDLS